MCFSLFCFSFSEYFWDQSQYITRSWYVEGQLHLMDSFLTRVRVMFRIFKVNTVLINCCYHRFCLLIIFCSASCPNSNETECYFAYISEAWRIRNSNIKSLLVLQNSSNCDVQSQKEEKRVIDFIAGIYCVAIYIMNIYIIISALIIENENFD